MSSPVRLLFFACAVALPASADALRPLPQDCGNVTAQGTCNGSVIQYCDTVAMPNVLVTIDCTAQFGQGAQCVPGTNGARATCAAPIGGPCLQLDANGSMMSIPCIGNQPGCLQNDVASACTDALGVCQPGQIGTCGANNRLMVGCRIDGQPWLLDCPAFGATCSNGACVGADRGEVCGPNVLCEAPLVCGRLSRCEDPPDAGVPTVRDAGNGTGDTGGIREDVGAPDTGGGVPPAPDAAATAPDAEPAPDAISGAPVQPDTGVASAVDAAAPAADAGTLGTEGTSDCSCATASETRAPALSSTLFVLALVVVARRKRR